MSESYTDGTTQGFFHSRKITNPAAIYMLRNDCKPDGLINRPPVYKPVSQFVIQLAAFETTRRSINWPNSLQAGQTVYKLAERLVPRMNGRSCNHFHTRGSLPSAIRVFQQR